MMMIFSSIDCGAAHNLSPHTLAEPISVRGVPADFAASADSKNTARENTNTNAKINARDNLATPNSNHNLYHKILFNDNRKVMQNFLSNK